MMMDAVALDQATLLTLGCGSVVQSVRAHAYLMNIERFFEDLNTVDRLGMKSTVFGSGLSLQPFISSDLGLHRSNLFQPGRGQQLRQICAVSYEWRISPYEVHVLGKPRWEPIFRPR